MKRYASISIPLFLLLIFTSTSFAQNADPGKSNGAPAEAAKSIPAAPAITAASTPKELAAAALAAQGGDKFKNLKSMYLYGSANLYAPTSSQSIPGKFVMVTAGDKVRIDIGKRGPETEVLQLVRAGQVDANQRMNELSLKVMRIEAAVAGGRRPSLPGGE